MFTFIKCIVGVILMLGGAGLQSQSKNINQCDFICGAEAVLAGLIIIATA